MFEKMTESELRLLEKKLGIVKEAGFFEIHDSYNLKFKIENTGSEHRIIHTTMPLICGHRNNCFDEVVLNSSDAPNCDRWQGCIAPNLFKYVPKIYLASTFEPHIRGINIFLKEEIQRFGLFPILPQHLGQDNKTRHIYGGEIAQHSELKRDELGDEIGRWCEKMLRISDGCVVVLNRMKQDTSWECGLIAGLVKPAIAVYYDDDAGDPLGDLKENWMVRRTEFLYVAKFPGHETIIALEKLRNAIYTNN